MLALLVVSMTTARSQGMPLQIEVRDPQGAPIPSAAVRFLAEGECHAVDEGGRWTGGALSLPDGSELFLARGMTLDFDVLAPGYRPRPGSHVLRGGRADRVEVTLEPMDLTLAPDAPEPARATLEMVSRWREIALMPTRDAAWAKGLRGARARTAQHVEAWLQWQRETGQLDARATEICRMAFDDPGRCEP